MWRRTLENKKERQTDKDSQIQREWTDILFSAADTCIGGRRVTGPYLPLGTNETGEGEDIFEQQTKQS